jgi:prevent-host-death family protein
MTQQVSSFNAKTHLSNLLLQVQNGQEIIITKHNNAIARLVPFAQSQKERNITHVIDEIKKSRKSCVLNVSGGIEELRSEGRR